MLRLLRNVMEEGDYPGKSLGSYKSLNKYGHRLIKYYVLCLEARTCLKTGYAKDVEWRTYRDADKQAMSVNSLYTGTRARPINKRWLDVKEGRYTTIRNGDV